MSVYDIESKAFFDTFVVNGFFVSMHHLLKHKDLFSMPVYDIEFRPFGTFVVDRFFLFMHLLMHKIVFHVCL
jgi:hypothetical protein